MSIIAVHICLYFAARLYAALLNQERVYKWYHPDHTWITVAGGVILVGIALAALLFLVRPSAPEMLIAYCSLFATACIPIVRWQFRQKRERRAETERIKRRA